jgi:hypothetical protein
MLPALAELTDRQVWDDLFLVIALPRLEERPKIVDALQFLVEPAPELGGRSLYDVLTDMISRTTPENLYRFVYSMRRFVEADEPLLVPAMTGLRKAFYVNDTHPVVDLVHDVMAEATRNEAFFSTLFRIAEMPEFQETVRLASQMSKDGRLKELIGAVVTLFHKFALQGKSEIRPGHEPPFEARRRHDFAADDLGLEPPFEAPWDPNDPCRRLDTRVPMDDYNHGRFEDQLNDYLGCINADRKHGDVVQAVNFLRGERTYDGRTFFNLQIDLMKSLGNEVTREEAGDLADRWIRAVDDGRFYHMMDGMPFWVTRKVHGSADPAGAAGPVLRPLLELARPVMRQAGAGVRRLMDYGAKVLRRPDIPHILKYGEKLVDLSDECDQPPSDDPERPNRCPEPRSAPLEQRVDLERIKRWVRNKECDYNGGRQLRRAQEILFDYNNTATTWDLVPGTEQPRYGWERAEFKASLEPLFQKLADPEQSGPDKDVIQALLNVIRYFSLPSDPARVPDAYDPRRNSRQHYTPEYLARWLRERSDDYRLISYFYPGETRPRVRLVNTLDRLELVLINADFTYLLPENFGQKFLAMIGNAWGDEPPSIWPEAVRRQYPERERHCAGQHSEDEWRKLVSKGRCPMRMADAFREIGMTQQMFENVVGYPELPGCPQLADPNDPRDVQRAETTEWPTNTSGTPSWAIPLRVKASLYNLRQVLSVIQENLPQSGTPMAGGLKVLRDLFYELYTSSPVDARNPKAGWRNNLSVVTKLVRMGLTRQVGLKVARFPAIPSNPALLSREERQDHDALMDFFRTLVAGATSPEVRPLLDALFVESRDHELIWKILDRIFNVLDAGDGYTVPESRRAELAGKPAAEQRRIRAEWVREAARMRQLAFYTLAQAGPLGIIDPALKTTSAVLKRYRAYLTRHADKMEDFFRSKTVSHFMRALYEDGDEERKAMIADLLRDALGDPARGLDTMSILEAADSVGNNPWDIFSTRLDVILGLDEYKNLNLTAVAEDFLHFFQETPEDGYPRTSTIVREYVAARMSSKGNAPGDLEELLWLAERKPDDFYQVLETLSLYSENGELKDFVKLARRSLSAPPR